MHVRRPGKHGQAIDQAGEADHNFTGGGLYNVQNNPSLGVIGGGRYNLLDTNAWASVVTGGEYNSVKVSRAFLGGGSHNTIEKFDYLAALVGGESNSVWASHAFLGGGYRNLNHDVAGVLVGGYQDTLRSSYGFLGGGRNNMLDWNSDSAVLVGGSSNYINFGLNSFLGGGLSDTVLSSYSVLSGGRTNKISFSSDWAVISGGDSNNVAQPLSFIGGGCHNYISDGQWGVITGGCSNSIIDTFSFIGGGAHNSITASRCVIAGGISNMVSAALSSIGGGQLNFIRSGASVGLGVIGGGENNQLVEGTRTGIFSGSNNTIGDARNGDVPQWSVIAGGDSNVVLGKGAAAAIVGGKNLIAQSANQVVMGRYNKAKGNSLLTATGIIADDPLVIVGNGSDENSRTNAFEIFNSGYAITTLKLGGNLSNKSTIGGHYADNMIVAWGDYQSGAGVVVGFPLTATDRFGVAAVTKTAVGIYDVTLNVRDQDGANLLLAHGSIIVTPQPTPESPCVIATAKKKANTDNVYTIHLLKPSDCSSIDAPFYFQIVGRQ